MHRLRLLLPLVASILSLASAGLQTPKFKRGTNYTSIDLLQQQNPFSIYGDRPDDCPPCFNCNLEAFTCHQFANCTAATGRCACPEGWGGEDCSTPLCGSPASGNKERLPREGATCDCTEGWEGINCNVCQNDRACDALVPGGEGGVCYTHGKVVRRNYQNCDITNRKILEQLKEQKPQATFSCDAEEDTCNFQFWVDQRESFYCALDTCSFDFSATDDRNTTTYSCDNIRCQCVPGRMLCGENGSVDIGDFLKEEIKGPAHFTTKSSVKDKSGDGSVFWEPAMNDLIESIFGDPSIYLQCNAGECLHETEVPGYERPVKKINTPLIAGVIAGCALFVAAIILGVFYLSRRQNKYGPIALSDSDDDDENSKLMVDHKPAALYFQNVSYRIKGKQILQDIQGAVHPGELMAIMGASGAGKTSFLDILARKNKRGDITGDFYVNGEKVLDDEFRSVIGFVDQEDTLLPTLTVHETILDSAMLRLPREMSLAAKVQRVEDVERQLGIHHIRHQIIGSEEGQRGISGGEKRRVGIACELVTSPSILFLDEPTSGLDAYNAFNVVECLVNLVKTYNRTVVFTIHQPRSNIVALFDQLVLLAKGKVVYSGPFAQCQSYFDDIGFSCPPGFNIADYLVDLTMHAGISRTLRDDNSMFAQSDAPPTRASSTVAVKSIASTSVADTVGSPSESLLRPKAGGRKSSIRQQQERQLFTRKKTNEPVVPGTPGSENDDVNPEDARSDWLRMQRQHGAPPQLHLEDPDDLLDGREGDGTNLDILTSAYLNSEVASSIRSDTHAAITSASTANGANGNAAAQANGFATAGKVKGYHKASLPSQFVILSVRTWRNLYRNPMLMLTHYAIAIVLAVFLGFLFYGLTDDIAGFQNRLGLFIFLLSLFGFSTLTTLYVFASERLLFVRERAKGYYSPISYFAAKVVFDIIPLRLIPPLIMGAIVYPMTGLIPQWTEFSRFVLFLVLYNLAAASVCLFIGILFKDGGVANLFGSLVMLFSLLFSGFLLNRNSIPKALLWLQKLSIFHYGFEGLIVNEVRPLSLIDHKYGLDIEVPGAAILSSFGFNNGALRMDAVGLAIFCGVFLVLAYASMHFLLVERR